jgi:hypothetical protein
LWSGLLAALTLCAGAAFADTFGSGSNSFDIDFVAVGNPANPVDTTGFPRISRSVLYTYRIGKHEIISEYTIDKVNASGCLGSAKDPCGSNEPATSKLVRSGQSCFLFVFLIHRGA